MKTKYFLIIFLALFSCTDEPEEQTYVTNIRNNSTSIINLEGYNRLDELILNEEIVQNSNSSDCSYSAENFGGFVCAGDSVVIKFSNGKGYICAVRISNNHPELCFNNNDERFISGNSPSFMSIGNNIFEYKITQEDFENAFDLPE